MNMRFADLELGDHFIWATPDLLRVDTVTVNVKIAWSEDSGGCAVELATHQECVSPFPRPAYRPGPDPQELKEWIPADTPVIKLIATL